MSNESQLAKVRRSPSSVTSLSLTELATFPVEALACRNLKALKLERESFGSRRAVVPAEIGTLSRLEQLELSGWSGDLPDTIGRLTRLRSLWIDYSDLSRVPPSLGKLPNLESLTLYRLPKLRVLPAEIGRLRKLAVLDFRPSGVRSVHPAIFGLERLRMLGLSAHASLPPGARALDRLEELTISPRALRQLGPGLGRLRRLEKLTIRGEGKLSQLPSGIEQLESLVELDASNLGLTSLPDSLSRLTKLRVLNLCQNALTSAWPEISALSWLESLNVDDNRLPRSEAKRLEDWMDLPRSKRVAAAARERPRPAAPAAEKGAKVTLLGSVESVNSFLGMVVVDGQLASSWKGVRKAAGHTSSDWDRASQLLRGKGAGGPIEVGNGGGIVLNPGIGAGISYVFSVGERVVLVEGPEQTEVSSPDRRLLEYVASQPSSRARTMGTIAATSGRLAFVPITSPGTKRGSGLFVPVTSGHYAVVLEKHNALATDDSARVVVMPLAELGKHASRHRGR